MKSWFILGTISKVTPHADVETTPALIIAVLEENYDMAKQELRDMILLEIFPHPETFQANSIYSHIIVEEIKRQAINVEFHRERFEHAYCNIIGHLNTIFRKEHYLTPMR